jgi:lipopolysaccharide export system ATP-binding protein
MSDGTHLSMTPIRAAAGQSESRLEVSHLQKFYGSRKAVKDVSLAVCKGEVVGLLGPNGAGKTTIFYMIVGLVHASAGDIRIDGQSIEQMPIHRRAHLGLSYLPQEASIFRKLNVEDNVRAVLELQHDESGKPLSKAEIEKRLTALLQDLRVEHLRETPALALSGGERRRVEIARALATQPRFILLDEPFAGIDPIAVIEIQRIISFLKGRGAKRSASATTPTSSVMARCWRRAHRPRSSTTLKCVASILANTSKCKEMAPTLCTDVSSLPPGGAEVCGSEPAFAGLDRPMKSGVSPLCSLLGRPCLGRPGAAAIVVPSPATALTS